MLRCNRQSTLFRFPSVRGKVSPSCTLLKLPLKQIVQTTRMFSGFMLASYETMHDINEELTERLAGIRSAFAPENAEGDVPPATTFTSSGEHTKEREEENNMYRRHLLPLDTRYPSTGERLP